MNLEIDAEGIMNSIDFDFEFLNLPQEPNWCQHGMRFAEWCEKLCDDTDQRDVIKLNQAKILLLDKYFEWRNTVPKRHRDSLGSSRHVCIYQVFVSTYKRLRIAELSLTPPLLYKPSPPPPPPPPPRIPGLALGFKDD